MATFSNDDLNQLKQMNIPLETAEAQLKLFARGPYYPTLLRPCLINDGVLKVSDKDKQRYKALFSEARTAGRVVKFVPASGAATRMFKDLTQALENAHKNDEILERFMNEIKKFAFYPVLGEACEKSGWSLRSALKEKKYQDILSIFLTSEGLNYSNLPKGLVLFHDYPEGARSAFEDQLVEASFYVSDKNNKSKVHFTVLDEHMEMIKEHLQKAQDGLSDRGLNFELSYSVQKESTNTLALDRGGEIARDKEGRLLLRPGGHGALLENLKDLEGDIVFIKNIDNIVPESKQKEVGSYKEILGGILLDAQAKIFQLIKSLREENLSSFETHFKFLKENFDLDIPEEIKKESVDQQKKYLFDRLHRPLRVCGMVKNEGEPGGGPFWVQDIKGETSLQVIESSQVDTSLESQKKIWSSSAYFNPVDLVCGMRDDEGNLFDLNQYVDADTAFVSEKSVNGNPLKVLELPGLWNGAMAFWNTIFVEVPISTFNPVKTVLDLLRPEHQPE